MKHIFIFSLITLASNLYAQITNNQTFDCNDLQVKDVIEFQHEVQSALKPDPCHGYENYGTSLEMVYAPESGYTVTYYKVKSTVDYIFDPITCEVEMNIVSTDTVPVDTDLYPSKPGETTGGYYTVQMEMWRKAPNSRPTSFDIDSVNLLRGETTDVYVSKLETGKYSGYWIVHCGKFNTKEKALAAAKYIAKNTEFCSSFARYLDSGIEFQGIYTN